MNISKAVIAGIAATSAMTAFSYLISRKNKENYKEPQLLSQMEEDILPGNAKVLAEPVGWVTHYGVGIAFAFAYKLLWQRPGVSPGIKSGLLLGAASGIIGALVWKAAFSLHPDKPRLPYTKFYMQLVPAHMIFGVTAALTDRAINKLYPG